MNTRKRISLNLDVRGLSQPATLAINERSINLRRDGHTVYRLGLGQAPFPVPAPAVDSLRLHAGEKDYLPVRGLPGLRRAVATESSATFGMRGVSSRRWAIGVADTLSAAGVRVHPPVGAFYLFLDFSPFADHLAKRGITDGPTLRETLLQETGVAILPGMAFERPRRPE